MKLWMMRHSVNSPVFTVFAGGDPVATIEDVGGEWKAKIKRHVSWHSTMLKALKHLNEHHNKNRK